MSERTNDQIRAMLERAVSDVPGPLPWTEIEPCPAADGAPRSPAPRRAALWLGVAACTIALVAALVAVIATRDEVRIDDEPVPTTTPTTSTPDTTTSPTTSDPPAAESGWSGGLLDDLDTESLRPLDAYVDGDVIIPTAPSGWRVDDAGWTGDGTGSGDWRVSVTQAPPDNLLGHVLHLRMSDRPTCVDFRNCEPWGEPVTIDGVAWVSLIDEGLIEEFGEDSEEFIANMTVRAPIGDRWVFVQTGSPQALTGPLLENPPIVEFLASLRFGAAEKLAAIGEACWQCGAAGAEGDPFAVTDSPAAPSTTMLDNEPTQTSQPAPSTAPGLDSGTGRPLTELAAGDVVVPTYIPPGLELRTDAEIVAAGAGTTERSVYLSSADNPFANSVRLWEGGAPWSPLGPEELEDPNHPPVEIAGLTWGWIEFEHARAADIGSFAIWVYLHGLDRSEAERFIEGLRAVPAEQFQREKQAVASAEVRGTRLVLNAAPVDDEICMSLDRADTGETIWPSGCFDPSDVDETFVIDLAQLAAGPNFDQLAPGEELEYVLVGYIDAPSGVDVRALFDGVSVEGRSAAPTDIVDGVFVLMSVNELDDVIDVEGGFNTDTIQLEVIEPSD